MVSPYSGFMDSWGPLMTGYPWWMIFFQNIAIFWWIYLVTGTPRFLGNSPIPSIWTPSWRSYAVLVLKLL